MKESNSSESGCLINLFYSKNTSPISISNLVMYWVINHSLDGVNSVQPGINLQWIPIPSRIQSKWEIDTYEKKKYIIQLCNLQHVSCDLT